MTVHRGTQANGTMTVYQAIASDIKGMGIYIVFGLMSDDICPLIATLDAMGIEFCSARHENNGIMMAVGYAAASRKLGVAMVGRGPAMANAMHGIMAASRSGQRVLVITGDAPASSHTANRPGPDIKHYAASAVLGAAGIRTFHAGTPGSARDALAEASAYASAGQTGVLLIPTDILMGEVNVSRSGPEKPLRAQLSPPLPQQPSLDLALQLIDRSRTPLIIGGYGAYNAGAKEALQALAERTGALLATTLKGKDLFHGHPADIGIVGSSSTSLARACIEGSDCILAFGASLNSLTTNSGSALPPVPIIHIDTDRKNIGRWHRADVAIAGDAKAVAEELLARASARPADRKPHHSAELLQRIRNFSHESDFASASTQRTCDPRTLALKLDQMLPVDRHVIYDGGNFMAVWAYISVAHPGRFTHTLDFGSIGLSLGAAVGAAKAGSAAVTVALVGDGGLLMSLGELETIAREAVPVIVVVMNDAAYGSEVHHLRSHGLPVAKAKFADVDFAGLAATLGFEVHTVQSVDALESIMSSLQEIDGPVLIDCKINGNVIAPFMGEFTHSKPAVA